MAYVTIVTGASSGLGNSISKLLASKGHNVYVTARRENELLNLKKECSSCKGKIIPISGDLTDEKFRVKFINLILKKEKKIDYLINNAGYGTFTEFQRQELNDVRNMLELNIVAYAHLIQLVLPTMLKRKKGRIINIASAVYYLLIPYFTIYTATKYAVAGLTKSLDVELRGTGVSISAIFPARMRTGFASVAFPKKEGEKIFNKGGECADKVALYIVKNLDNKKLFQAPTLKAKFIMLISKICSCMLDIYINKVLLRKIKKLLKK